jgi:hypothetical protein
MQHLPGMVAQVDVVHRQRRRLDRPGEILPGLQDRLHVILDETAESILDHFDKTFILPIQRNSPRAEIHINSYFTSFIFIGHFGNQLDSPKINPRIPV